MADFIDGTAKNAKELARKAKSVMVSVEVLKPFEGHQKGDIIKVPERKLRKSSRPFRKGYYKPVKDKK